MTDIDKKDVHFMREALKEAHYALSRDEVPIGAIVVLNDRVVARAHNLTEALNDATAHAEMQALTAAANTIGGKYLDKCNGGALSDVRIRSLLDTSWTVSLWYGR
jgi:tRNA(adenine34) deaminase